MNYYMVISTTGDVNARITAIDEKDARRIFKAEHKGAEIASVAVISEGVPATKQQEREAIEQIKDILETLGSDSYCATAFEGAIEDAQDNIRDDAAYSMKARYESTQIKLRKEMAEHAATKMRLQTAIAEIETLKAQATKRETEHAQAMEKAKREAISPELRDRLRCMAQREYARQADFMKIAADNMAFHMGRTGSATSERAAAAASEYRTFKLRQAEAKDIMDSLTKIAADQSGGENNGGQ